MTCLRLLSLSGLLYAILAGPVPSRGFRRAAGQPGSERWGRMVELIRENARLEADRLE